MKKKAKHCTSTNNGKYGMKILVLLLVLSLSLFSPVKSSVACCGGTSNCETPGSIGGAMNPLVADDIAAINAFILAIEGFLFADLNLTSAWQILTRVDEFSTNIWPPMNAWWEAVYPAFRPMTGQLSIVRPEQTRAIGAMLDAQLMNESITKRYEKQLETRHRYTPDELSCQMDTLAFSQVKSYQMSRALARGFVMDELPRRGNSIGTVSELGPGGEMGAFDYLAFLADPINDNIGLWKEYTIYLCYDDTDQGCPPLAGFWTWLTGKQGSFKDIPDMLWGNDQTLYWDPGNFIIGLYDLLMVRAGLRYLIYPRSEDPVFPTAVNTPEGHRAILERRTEQARVNTVYNVVGQMLSEHIGHSNLDVIVPAFPALPWPLSLGLAWPWLGSDGQYIDAILTSGGLHDEDRKKDSSYREMQEAMVRQKYYNPAYFIRLIEDTEQIAREQITTNAFRLQIMNDTYRRAEEMLFMEAAIYARDLDKQTLPSAFSSRPME
ncbi:MAG: hypothetical protein KAS59_03070 [Alphaproteobacteria bacterium]|nr:hypothetical protein [Alphaproteobacteria bacterium]